MPVIAIMAGSSSLTELVSRASTMHQDAAKKLLSLASTTITAPASPTTTAPAPQTGTELPVQSVVMVSLFLTIILLALIGGCMHLHRSCKKNGCAYEESLNLVTNICSTN